MTKTVTNKPDDLTKNDLIIQAILGNIPSLTRGDVYLAKDLMGPDVWNNLDNGMHIGIGGVVRQLVEARLLPLTYLGKTSSNKNIYRLD